MEVGLALDNVAPGGAEAGGATLRVPAGAIAVLAGREDASRSGLVRVLLGLEAARGTLLAGAERHDLAAGPPPPSLGLGAVLDPPVLQSSLTCGENVRLGQRAAPRGRGRPAGEVVAALEIEGRMLDLQPGLVPPRTRQVVSLAQMLAAGKRAVVWNLARSDLWVDLERAHRRFPEVTWLVLAASAGAARRRGELAGILEGGHVSCFGRSEEVRNRLPFAVALRAEAGAGVPPAHPRPGTAPESQRETSSR